MNRRNDLCEVLSRVIVLSLAGSLRLVLQYEAAMTLRGSPLPPCAVLCCATAAVLHAQVQEIISVSPASVRWQEFLEA
jgi:hypothetical protein